MKRIMAILTLLLAVSCAEKKKEHMDKEMFWQIIEKCKDPDKDAMLEHLTNELAAYQPEEIKKFGWYLGFYANTAMEIPSAAIACKAITGYVTDDGLLYFCLWLVAQGKGLYFASLENPDALISIPKIDTNDDNSYPEFEMLMYIVYDLLEGEDEESFGVSASEEAEALADYSSRNIEMKWPNDAWPTDEVFMDAVRKRAPKLMERYSKN